MTDPSGAAVPNATISATNAATGVVRTTPTNSTGQFILPALQIGKYTLRAEAAGFKKSEQTGIVLEVGDRNRVDFALQIGSAQESVTVEATAVAVQSESGEVSDVISGTQVSQLAANGRSIYSLAAMTAGASSNMPDYQSATPVAGNATVAFNGRRTSSNIYLIDGGENLDRGGSGNLSVMPSMDAIAEFRQLTSNYGAEYGLSSGATMTMVLKSGTKDFHGSAWEFLRNEALDANSFFRNRASQPKGVNRLNTYGFNVGGPVFIPGVYNKNKDKSFFFFNMEWRKLLQGGALNTQVPLTSAYGGNLAGTGYSAFTPYECQVSSAIQAKFAAAGLNMSGCTGGAPDATKRVAMSTIPTALLDTNAQALLKAGLFPAPNNGNRFVGGNNAPTNVREEIIRADHHFTDKFWVFGHFIAEAIDQNFGTTMWSGDNVPTAANTFGNPSYSGVIHAVATISPTVLNETAFNYNGNRINILPASNSIVARPSGFNVPELVQGNKLNRIPSIALNNQTGTNYTMNWIPWTNKADDYQIRDDVSWTKGSHQLKFGASWALYAKAQTYFANTQGNFGFNGNYTGYDFADFLVGLANNYSEDAYQGIGNWKNVSYAAYVQDTWKVSSRLTLNLGLRWDGIPHTYEANNYHANFYPNLYDKSKMALINPQTFTILPNSPGLGTSPIAAMQGINLYLNGIGIAGANGISKNLVKTHWAAFGPRVGFAYDATGKGKTIIRGGFGAMYERIQGNDMYNGATNNPFGATMGLSNVTLSDPNVSIATGAKAVAPINITGLTGMLDEDYKSPISMQFSFGVQQEVAKNSVLSVSYVGNQNRHQNSYTDINNPLQSNLASIINGTANRTLLVPYIGWGGIRMSGNNMNSSYNGLQTNFRSQIKDLSLQFVYTYSKANDPLAQSGGAGDMTNVGNPYDRYYDKGASPMDRRHIAIVNFVYDLPVFRGNQYSKVVKGVLGGWQVSGIVTMQTGLPLQLTQGGPQGSNGLANGTNRPDLAGSIELPHTLTSWFGNAASTNSAGRPCKGAFCAPVVGAWGTAPRDAIYGPGRHNWNVSLFKSFVFSEARGSRLELRFETFNMFNHTQYQNVSSGFSNGDFGQVTSTWNPRNLQLAAKIQF